MRKLICIQWKKFANSAQKDRFDFVQARFFHLVVAATFPSTLLNRCTFQFAQNVWDFYEQFIGNVWSPIQQPGFAHRMHKADFRIVNS